jgi:type VI protein secretion system component VasK
VLPTLALLALLGSALLFTYRVLRYRHRCPQSNIPLCDVEGFWRGTLINARGIVAAVVLLAAVAYLTLALLRWARERRLHAG